MSARRRISTGSPFEAKAGYARAVVQDGWCFVAGTTGYDYAAMTMPGSAAAQARNALATIAAALGEACFDMEDIVRVTYYLTDPAFWDEVCPVLGETFGAAPPAATAIVCGLVAPEMKIEIEVTALKRERE